MSDKERLMQILSVPIYNHECVNPIEVVADFLLGNGVTFVTETNISHNPIPYEERRKVYSMALAAYGDLSQMIVAIEELSECQKEICKILRGGENFPHLAEEIADATIMLEQLRLIFNINDAVNEYMDAKVRRLEEKVGGTRNG
jgi:hypothetical protein